MREPTKRGGTASLKHERHYQRAGFHIIAGIDEVGRGPLAGPVVAAAVVLPLSRRDLPRVLNGARDSKQMTAKERERLNTVIKAVAIGWGVGCADAGEIDAVGIVAATQSAMLRAINALSHKGITPDCLFIDYMLLPDRATRQVSLVDGDQRSLSIACASIVAKVWRDNFMRQLDAKYPQYGFARNKGYGAAAHIEALRLHGPCPAHRRSFAPVRDALIAQGEPREARAGA